VIPGDYSQGVFVSVIYITEAQNHFYGNGKAQARFGGTLPSDRVAAGVTFGSNSGACRRSPTCGRTALDGQKRFCAVDVLVIRGRILPWVDPS
jgi:hypothetical protein